MNQEVVLGMVLSAMPIGEYDKRVVILTKEHGKISAFAKGARRPNSTLLACAQPFVFGKFTLYQGRNSYSVIAVEAENYFGDLKEDLEAVSYGIYFCEVAAYLTCENVEASNILKLLYQSLRALGKKSISNRLIRYIYELKILCYNGEAPQVFECVKCKKNTQMVQYAGFSSKAGGMLCNHCAEKENDILFLKDSTIYTLQYIVASPIEKLYTFTITEEIMEEFRRVMESYKKVYLNVTFHSLEMIDLLIHVPAAK